MTLVSSITTEYKENHEENIIIVLLELMYSTMTMLQ